MNENQKIYYNIFMSCTLNEDFYIEKKTYIFSYDDPRLINVNDQKTFDDAISKFLVSNEGKHTSQRFLLMTVRRALCEARKKSISNINEIVVLFINIIKEVKISEFFIIKNLYGATLKESDVPLKFGPLVVYELPRHQDRLEKAFPLENEIKFDERSFGNVIITCDVKAKDYLKALDIANDIFNTFDLIISFLLRKEYSKYSVGILRVYFAPYQSTRIYNKDMAGCEPENKNNFGTKLEISNLSRFIPKIEQDLFNRLLDIIVCPKSTIEKKISTAVKWVGESYSDRNLSTSFLKAVIALEALLKIDERSVITPSIMSSIAEQCAYLNGRSAEECLEIESKIKEIYGQRSKIAHTGFSSVSVEILEDARVIIHKTILNFVRFVLGSGCKSSEAFQLVLRQKKYQNGGLSPLGD